MTKTFEETRKSKINRSEEAVANFRQGYNCAQSVALAFSDLLDIDDSQLSTLSSSFGGGMGRLREVCGAVSGMFMVAGLLYGYDGPETGEVKTDHYARIQQLAHEFEETNGAIVCRELLKLRTKHDDPTPDKRTEKYYEERPCEGLVRNAAEILDIYISKN